MDVVILTGGKGSRLKNISGDNIPKPMMNIGGRPNLESQVMLCVSQGFKKFHFLSGYKANVIKEYFGNGEKWDCDIIHHSESSPLGTAGALISILNIISPEILLIYGDVYMDIEIKSIIEFHTQNKADVTLTVHSNRHPYDSDLVELSQSSQIKAFHSRPYNKNFFTQNNVNAGAIILKKELLKLMPKTMKPDIAADVFPFWLSHNKIMFGYKTIEYMRDIGTPERYNQVNQEVTRGKHLKLHKHTKKRAVFLINYGEITQCAGYLYDLNNFKLQEGVDSSINIINDTDLLAILISCPSSSSFKKKELDLLKELHNKLEWNLGKSHAKFDEIYFSNKRRNNQNTKNSSVKDLFNVLCSAIEKHNIDITKSYILSDSSLVVEYGIDMSLKCIYFGNKNDAYANLKLEYNASNFKNACIYISEKELL